MIVWLTFTDWLIYGIFDEHRQEDFVGALPRVLFLISLAAGLYF